MGAAWVFARTGSSWTQQGPKLAGAGVSDNGWFGWSVALSGDASTALIGSYPDDSSTGATWASRGRAPRGRLQSAPVASGGSDGSGGSYFGFSVGLSGDGSSAVVGGPTDSNQLGAAWGFSRSGPGWSQLGPKLTGSAEGGTGLLGNGVAVSADGSTILTGGPGDVGDMPENASLGAAWAFVSTAVPVPPAPTDVRAASGPSRPRVSFTPPAGPVTSYEVVALPGGATARGTSSPIVVPGLTVGASYTFRVVAVNAAGTGAASAASNAVVVGNTRAPDERGGDPGRHDRTGELDGARVRREPDHRVRRHPVSRDGRAGSGRGRRRDDDEC